MTVDPNFRAASEAVEQWPRLLAEINLWAKGHELMAASTDERALVVHGKLVQLRWGVAKHGPTITAVRAKPSPAAN